jgi:hypothetical protein
VCAPFQAGLLLLCRPPEVALGWLMTTPSARIARSNSAASPLHSGISKSALNIAKGRFSGMPESVGAPHLRNVISKLAQDRHERDQRQSGDGCVVVCLDFLENSNSPCLQLVRTRAIERLIRLDVALDRQS